MGHTSIEALLVYLSLFVLTGAVMFLCGYRLGRSSRPRSSDSSWLTVTDQEASPLVSLPWNDVLENTAKFQHVLRLHLAHRILLIRKQSSDPETITAASAELLEKALGLAENISELVFSDASMTQVGKLLETLRSRLLNEPSSLRAQVATLAGAVTVVSAIGIFAALAGLAACVLRMRESWSVGEKLDYLIEIERSKPHGSFRTAYLLARQQLSSGRIDGLCLLSVSRRPPEFEKRVVRFVRAGRSVRSQGGRHRSMRKSLIFRLSGAPCGLLPLRCGWPEC
jgi:hypothetical protein